MKFGGKNVGFILSDSNTIWKSVIDSIPAFGGTKGHFNQNLVITLDLIAYNLLYIIVFEILPMVYNYHT